MKLKLIDILARELKVWPWDAGDKVVQFKDGSIHGISNGFFKMIESKERFTLAADQLSALISKADWLNAVMALEVDNVKFNNPVNMNGPVTAEWNGEGLPPVGMVCEFAGFNQDETKFDDPVVGDKVTVIAHYLSGCVQVAAFTYNLAANFGSLNVAQGAHGCFRPIRTAEQTAAEEREKAIKSMIEDSQPDYSAGDFLNASEYVECAISALYDSGYRKQVAK